MKPGIVISAILEPLRKPALIEENDLKLNILEALKEGPLNLSDLSKKTGIKQRKLIQILSAMQEEGTLTKLKTRFKITDTGLGVVKGFIEPSADEKLEVIAQLASYPNSSTIDLLRLRSQNPGYLDVVELTSALDALRDSGSIERNGTGWNLSEALLGKITRIIGNKKEPERDLEVKETERQKPKIKEKNPVDKKPKPKKPDTLKEQAKPPDPTTLPPPPTPPSDFPPDPEPLPPPNLPSGSKPPDPPPDPTPPLLPPLLPPPSTGTLVDPFTFRARSQNGISGHTPNKPTSNAATKKEFKPNPTLGILISQNEQASYLEDKKVKAIGFLKTAVIELQDFGIQIDEDALTAKGTPSEELVERLHQFLVLKSERVREILKFCSRNAASFKKAKPMPVLA